MSGQVVGSNRRALLCTSIALSAAMVFEPVRAQSTVLKRIDPAHHGALSARGELHALKPQLQRKSRCTNPSADTNSANTEVSGKEAEANSAALPTIVVCGNSDPERGDEIPQAKAVADAIIGAKVKPLEFGRNAVLSGVPPPGAGGAWTDPGNILFWLR